ncbi:hypothetical protein [Rossellomorea marisflavi]|uniref:hypothetical protein n=1 Tax=Rossellomorea marisflavi TaxID=189381 RepID=UPI001EE3065E|nr:hypothetical protein [Rossellomorea marisflavi]UKS64961.1 hypothetical protein K6T23_19865 [Rossellomorea marisflavi]
MKRNRARVKINSILKNCSHSITLIETEFTRTGRLSHSIMDSLFDKTLQDVRTDKEFDFLTPSDIQKMMKQELKQWLKVGRVEGEDQLPADPSVGAKRSTTLATGKWSLREVGALITVVILIMALIFHDGVNQIIMFISG